MFYFIKNTMHMQLRVDSLVRVYPSVIDTL